MALVQLELSTDQLELGKLYFRICRFDQAISALKDGILKNATEKNWSKFVQFFPLLLRIYAERLEFDKIKELRAQLEMVPSEFWVSKVYYTLGISAIYGSEIQKSFEFFDQAEKKSDNLQDLLQAIFGKAAVAFKDNQTEVACRLLHELDEKLRLTTFSDLKIATYCLQAHVYLTQKDFEKTLEALDWAERICRIEQNLYMSLNVFFARAMAFKKTGDLVSARSLLNLTMSLMSEEDLRHLSIQVRHELEEIHQGLKQPTMTLLQKDGPILMHPQKGEIKFQRHGILIELLKLFGENDGKVISKEQIVNYLWKQDYNPMIHDNKIYVTIRRLRQIIEMDSKKPTYLLSSNEGYFLQPGLRFILERV